MVDLTMSIFEFLTFFLIFWHPWVCVRSDLKQIWALPSAMQKEKKFFVTLKTSSSFSLWESLLLQGLDASITFQVFFLLVLYQQDWLVEEEKKHVSCCKSMCMWKYLLLLSGAYCLEAVRPSCNLHCGQIRKKDPESKPFLDLKNMSGCLFHGSRRLSSWRSHATLYSSSSAPSNLQLPITDDAILDFVFHYIRYLFLELAIVCCTILHRNKPAYPSKTNTCWILKPCPLFDQSININFLGLLASFYHEAHKEVCRLA